MSPEPTDIPGLAFFAKNFLEEPRRSRILRQLELGDWPELICECIHDLILIDKYTTPIRRKEDKEAKILDLLRSHGAGSDAILISECHEDNGPMSLEAAVNFVHTYGQNCPSVVLCYPLKLAYYRNTRAEAFLCKRKS